jgi:hypothetical protein
VLSTWYRRYALLYAPLELTHDQRDIRLPLTLKFGQDGPKLRYDCETRACESHPNGFMRMCHDGCDESVVYRFVRQVLTRGRLDSWRRGPHVATALVRTWSFEEEVMTRMT